MDESPKLTRAEKRARWWAETKVDLKWATALLFFLILAVSGFLWSSWTAEEGGATLYEEDMGGLTTSIFSEQVVPFEILSVLLLAALIAAVAIAFRDPEGGR